MKFKKLIKPEDIDLGLKNEIDSDGLIRSPEGKYYVYATKKNNPKATRESLPENYYDLCLDKNIVDYK